MVNQNQAHGEDSKRHHNGVQLVVGDHDANLWWSGRFS